MKRILITGGTGFVGRRLLAELVRQGAEVRALVRDRNRLDPSLTGRLEVVEGEMDDPQVIEQAMENVSHVLHLAALATAFERNPRRYFQVNAESLKGLLDAARWAGVERFVHVSSVAVQEPASQPELWGLSCRPTPYAQSKVVAEELVRCSVRQGLDVVIVRPSRIYGPGPRNDANGTTRLAALYLQGRFRFRIRDGNVRANYVHVDDVIQGLLLAARNGVSGQTYNLGGENASLQQFLAAISSVSGVRRRVLPVPAAGLVPVAHLAKLWGRMGGHTSLTPGWLNNFLEDRPMDITTARDDLGYRPRGLASGLSQTLDWLLEKDGGESHGGSKNANQRRKKSTIRIRKNWN